jgi:hypothetical protein
LRGSGDRALKADRLLFDLIMKLKADCLESKIFVCKFNMTHRYKPYASGSVHPLDADQEYCLMLSCAGASDQIENASSLARDLSFLLFVLESPFDLCY